MALHGGGFHNLILQTANTPRVRPPAQHKHAVILAQPAAARTTSIHLAADEPTTNRNANTPRFALTPAHARSTTSLTLKTPYYPQNYSSLPSIAVYSLA